MEINDLKTNDCKFTLHYEEYIYKTVDKLKKVFPSHEMSDLILPDIRVVSQPDTTPKHELDFIFLQMRDNCILDNELTISFKENCIGSLIIIKEPFEKYILNIYENIGINNLKLLNELTIACLANTIAFGLRLAYLFNILEVSKYDVHVEEKFNAHYIELNRIVEYAMYKNAVNFMECTLYTDEDTEYSSDRIRREMGFMQANSWLARMITSMIQNDIRAPYENTYEQLIQYKSYVSSAFRRLKKAANRYFE